MPAWAITLLITVLQKTGAITWAEAVAFKAGRTVITKVGELKTYSAPTDFPQGKNGQ